MAVFLSAGHVLKGSDPGAVYGGYKEAELTAELRDLVTAHLVQRGVTVYNDYDDETLRDYLRRIKPGSGSVVCDLHFNASANACAEGTEVFVKNKSGLSLDLAKEICLAGAAIGLKSRGVKTPEESNRGKLGLFNLSAGAVVLLEVCFISNVNDMVCYQANKLRYAQRVAEALDKYDKLT